MNVFCVLICPEKNKIDKIYFTVRCFKSVWAINNFVKLSLKRQQQTLVYDSEIKSKASILLIKRFRFLQLTITYNIKLFFFNVKLVNPHGLTEANLQDTQ